MFDTSQCPACGSASRATDGAGTSMQSFECSVCRHRFHVHSHAPLEQAAAMQLFNAIITVTDADDPEHVRSVVSSIFEDTLGFDPHDVDRQLNSGARAWDLGWYSQEEVARLAPASQAHGLLAEFRPRWPEGASGFANALRLPS
jgi:hypothetical protein